MATPAPWINPWDDDVTEEQSDKVMAQNGEMVVGVSWYDCPRLYLSKEDANFICHSREDIPYLISEIERLQTELKRVEDERDAAIEDLREAFGRCEFCKYNHFANDESPCVECTDNCDNWEWHRIGVNNK